ncbi:MAG: alpha-2-macroglobulin family protein [Zoogloeaceae bacterium]|nr:alpha-2-macroglobulin family protein [Zoogloeaceae bacterium]
MNISQRKTGVILGVAVLLLVMVLGVSLGQRLRGGASGPTAAGDSAAVKALEAEMEESSGPIELVELNNRDLDGSPALALTFTQTLDARQDYDEFIQVFAMPTRAGDKTRRSDDEDENEGESSHAASGAVVASTAPEDVSSAGGAQVSGSWVVGENPRLLFFPHIKPETRYVVRVAPGVPAKNGNKTHAESRYSIVTAAVSPAYYFASKGIVLPARQNGGLPVVTVNVPEVDVQFLRVKPEQISRFLDRVIGGNSGNSGGEDEDDEYYSDNRSLKGAVNNWELDRFHAMTESVYSGRFLTEQKANRRSVTFLPVEDIKELAEPGIYIAVMSQPNRFRYEYQVTYFYTSNLGLHTRLFEKRADAYVSGLDDGKAIAGVEVSWLDPQGKILLQSKTDAEGRAHFAERPRDARVLMARRDKEVALIALKEPALDLSEYDISGFPGRAVSLFAYSGRNLYRPGERFEVSVLARDADGHPVPEQPVQAILKGPDGKAQFTATWQPEQLLSGYYQRALEVPADAATGFWNLELRADPADKRPSTVYRFGVEEFLPERMKLDLSAASAQLDAKHPFALKVAGNYLYGAPAAGNRLLGVASFARQKNPLAAKLPGFEFGDANEDSARHREELKETTLDESGKASLDIDLDKAADRHSPFMVRATMSLLESGGRPVIRSLERTYWPAPQLLAVRPLFTGDYAQMGSPVSFEVIRADANGKLSGGAFPARLFREDRDYYWRFEDGRGWHSGYTETDELVASTSVNLPAGQRGKLTLPVKYGRYRLEIHDPETGKRLLYRFYAGWSAKSDESQGVRPDRVNLKLDKPAYKEGETAHLTITPPHAGEALISVESDRTLWVQRVAVPAEGKTVDIPVKPEWLRHDLYVSVLVLRPGKNAQATPARALGLAYLPLERGERKLDVKLDAPKKMLPETPLKVKIKVPGLKSQQPGQPGQKAQVTLSAVDVGILNITNFASPDPFGHFFGKLRYGADQYDVYGRLIEKMDGQKGKLKFGGDAAPQASKSLPKKVRLVDLFSGPVILNSNGEAEITLPVPDFNGQLRLMAVVAAADRFGSAEAEITVAAPLVAELSTPRFLTLGDSAIVALDLHNLSGADQDLQVELANEGGLRIGDAKRKVSLKDQQKVTLRFPLEAGRAFGLTPVSVKVSGSVNLSREFALEVEAATPRQQILRRYVLAPGESLNLQADLGGLLPSTVVSHLTVSDTPPLDVKTAIRGLLTYPYGCAEQTTSTAYPHVFIGAEEAKAFGLKTFTREERANMLEKAIARLGAMQAPNGGFSLWGNASHYEYWLSSYVSNFLLDAREQGFVAPERMQQQAMDFLLKGFQEGVSGLPAGAVNYDENSVWRDYHYAGSGRFAVLAYGGYVLARQSKAPLSTLRQLYDLRARAHSGLALVHLGLALHLMGDEKRGETAIAEGLAKARPNDRWWGDYGSDLRDAALSYALLERHQIKANGKENLISLIARELELKDRWSYTSTQEKLALFLVARQMFATAETGTPWTVNLANRAGVKTLTNKGTLVQSLEAAELGSVKLSNPGQTRLYLELALEGHPVQMPAARRDAVELRRVLYDSEGKPLGNRSLKVGESVLVLLEVKPRVNIANALVVDRIPAGLEIENLNIVQGEGMETVKLGDVDPAQVMGDTDIQHVEFRDDRFAVALRLRGGTKNLVYRARVVTPGKFVFPPLYAEDMYRPQVYGLAEGEGSVTVTEGTAR